MHALTQERVHFCALITSGRRGLLMCRSPLCSLMKMFPSVHSPSSSGVSGAVAENKAQETLAVGEVEFNQQQLEKASRAKGAVRLA